VSYIQLTPLNVNFAVFALHLDTFDVTHYAHFVARDSERVWTTCIKRSSFGAAPGVAADTRHARLNWICVVSVRSAKHGRVADLDNSPNSQLLIQFCC
jgi:hypothetical protein